MFSCFTWSASKQRVTPGNRQGRIASPFPSLPSPSIPSPSGLNQGLADGLSGMSPAEGDVLRATAVAVSERLRDRLVDRLQPLKLLAFGAGAGAGAGLAPPLAAGR